MPLTQDDLAVLTQLIGQTVSTLLQAQATQAQNQVPTATERVEERHYRKVQHFNGSNWKDWSFQFKSASRSSSEKAYELLNWAEREVDEIDDLDDETEVKLSGELFNLLTTMMVGEPLQLLHNCDFNGLEAWRRLAKRYSPSTPLRAMQLMLQIVSPEKAKSLKEVPTIIDKWETRVMILERDFKEKISSRMKAAILISILPNELRDALIQQADKYEEY